LYIIHAVTVKNNITEILTGRHFMDRSTVTLLKECNSGCHMAIGSMEQVLGTVHDKNLRKLIDSYNKKHEELRAESEELLRNAGETEKKPGNMAAAFAWLSTEMKMMVNDSSHQIASVMTDGCNMGIKTISEYINKYDDASEESIKLAEKLVSTEEAFMHDLRTFM
jgi:hypothetical protein